MRKKCLLSLKILTILLSTGVLLGTSAAYAQATPTPKPDPLVKAREKAVEKARKNIAKAFLKLNDTQEKLLAKAKRKNKSFCRYRRGDFNLDGAVNPQDGVLTQNCPAFGPTSLICIGADLDGNGTVDSTDAELASTLGSENCNVAPTPTPTAAPTVAPTP